MGHALALAKARAFVNLEDVKRFLFLFGTVALLASTLPGWSRVVPPLTSEDAEKADLICTGTLVSQGAFSGDPNGTTEAVIKVLGVSKGQASGEIKVRLCNKFPVINGPFPVDLHPSVRYRFFLCRVPDQDAYVTVLKDAFEEFPAVQKLEAGEPDKRVLLFKPEAIQIALAAMKRTCPSWVPVPGTPDVRSWHFPDDYQVWVNFKDPVRATACVVVKQDRTIGTDSWYRPANFDSMNLTGRTVRFYLATDSQVWLGKVDADTSKGLKLTLISPACFRTLVGPFQTPWGNRKHVKISSDDMSDVGFPIE
jgi:hypothetical protein